MSVLRNSQILKRAIKFYVFTFILIAVITLAIYLLCVITNDYKGLPSIPTPNTSESIISRLLDYFINNALIVPLVMLILALIPIPLLYYLNVVSTVFSISPIFGIYLAYNVKFGVSIIVCTLPHMLFEVMGLSIVCSLLFDLNKCIRSKFFKKNNMPFKMVVSDILKVYILIVWPLMIIAAILESLLSVWLYHHIL